MEEKNFLQNRKVTVKVVNKYRSGFPKNSAGNTIWDGCKRVYQAPTNTYDRLIPILTEEECRFFEIKMGMPVGGLNFNRKTDNFWKEFTVTIEKTTRTLDLMEPEDYLAWKVLLNSNNVANSEDLINDMIHDFYLVDDQAEEEVTMRLADRYEEAMKLYMNNISKSEKKMTSVLRLLGKTVPTDASMKWLKAEIIKILEQKAKVPGVKNMDDFIAIAKDPNFDTRIFLMDALEIGEVYTEGSTYKLRAGDTIGFDHDQAISYFNNPKNQQIRLLIEERLKTNK